MQSHARTTGWRFAADFMEISIARRFSYAQSPYVMLCALRGLCVLRGFFVW